MPLFQQHLDDSLGRAAPSPRFADAVRQGAGTVDGTKSRPQARESVGQVVIPPRQPVALKSEDKCCGQVRASVGQEYPLRGDDLLDGGLVCPALLAQPPLPLRIRRQPDQAFEVTTRRQQVPVWAQQVLRGALRPTPRAVKARPPVILATYCSTV